MCVEVDQTNAKIKAWSSKFFDKYLPQGIDSFILLTRHLQDRYMQEKKVCFFYLINNIYDLFLVSSSTRLYNLYEYSYE